MRLILNRQRNADRRDEVKLRVLPRHRYCTSARPSGGYPVEALQFSCATDHAPDIAFALDHIIVLIE